MEIGLWNRMVWKGRCTARAPPARYRDETRVYVRSSGVPSTDYRAGHRVFSRERADR